MSEPTPPTSTPDQRADEEWPDTCPECGTRLQQVAVDFTAGSPQEVGATADVAGAVFEDRCPNPDCPAHRATGSSGASPGDRQPDQPTLPGSMGGENGGA